MSKDNDPYDDDDDYDVNRWKKSKKDRRERNPFDFLGNFGRMFDNEDFLTDFQSVFDELLNSPMFKGLFDQLSKNAASGGFPFVWGFSMRQGPDGKPMVQPFGNVKAHDNAPNQENASSNVREPLVDLFEEESCIRVIIEMPGVEKKDVELSATERKLQIDAKTEDRQYHKELDLPDVVVPDSAKARFKNGVLEVELKRVSVKPKTDKKINIE